MSTEFVSTQDLRNKSGLDTDDTRSLWLTLEDKTSDHDWSGRLSYACVESMEKIRRRDFKNALSAETGHACPQA